ncbi:MAG: hypothetical protein N2554_11730 [Fimbriimonadales bacterium]|nr:hypothetical protein [Fimbriimonadales bacterium]
MRTTRDEIVVSERQIEDILATYTDLLAELLGAPMPLRVLARQMELPNGERLDLLCLAGGQLHLVELKVEPARQQFIEQVASYSEQVSLLQNRGTLPEGSVQAYLLAPEIPEKIKSSLNSSKINLVEYSVSRVLERFFAEFSSKSATFSVSTRNHGVRRLGLTNRIVCVLRDKGAMTASRLCQSTKLSDRTVKCYLTPLIQLGIVERDGNKFCLTSKGADYSRYADYNSMSISEEQSARLRQYILKNPFADGVPLGILTVVENVAILSRNGYPVSLSDLSEYFTLSTGNKLRWNAQSTRYNSVRMYIEYAAELGLLARIGDLVYLTLEGMRFNLMLQMHKAIQLVEPLHLKQL